MKNLFSIVKMIERLLAAWRYLGLAPPDAPLRSRFETQAEVLTTQHRERG